MAEARGRTRLHRAREAGQGIAEFALVFPVIALLIFAVIDCGRAVYAYNTVANAAREGARVAAVNQLDPGNSLTGCNEDMPIEDITSPHWWPKSCAAAAAVSLGLTPANVTITYAAPGDQAGLDCSVTLHVGCIATVTVTYAWSAVTPGFGSILGPMTMTFSSQMPLERVFP